MTIHGKVTHFTEAQVVEIKKLLGVCNSATRGTVEKAVTGIERQQTIATAIRYLQEDMEAMKAQLESANRQVQTLLPKGDFYDAVTSSSRTMDVGQVAKLLCVKGFGRNKLMEFLREFSVFDKHNAPYQQFVDKGYFKRVETRFNLPNGEVGVGMKTVVFQKGVDYIEKLLMDNGYYPSTLNDK